MKSKNIILYTFEFFALIYILIFKMMYNLIPKYASMISVGYWLLLTLIVYIIYGYPRNKNYLKGSATRTIIIAILSFLIISFGLGLILGFEKNIIFHGLKGIVLIGYDSIIVCILKEYLRYVVAKNSTKNLKPLLLLTIIYIILDITMQINTYNLKTFEGIFCFICVTVMTSIALQALYSFITYKISYTPTLILALTIAIYPYALPIFPALGDYIKTCLFLIFAFVIYLVLTKTINQYDKTSTYLKRFKFSALYIPVILVLFVLISLISGIFGYQIVTIGSNSMKNEYSRGDAVIYEKVSQSEIKKLQVGMILVFKKDNLIITHRITKIDTENGRLVFHTKGDNNEIEDNFLTDQKEVMGYVIYKVPYIGYPSVLLYETFEKNK